MAFELIYAVIHGFVKEAKSTVISDIVKKDVVLDRTLPAVVAVVKGVYGLLGKSGNSVSYGQFGDDMRQGPFPQQFKAYVDTPIDKNGKRKLSDEKRFLALSHTVVKELIEAAKDQPFATGGHILVAHYTSDNEPYMLIAMIKQQGGVTLDENYVPIEINEIDLKKVNQAARINIRRYLDVIDTPDSKDEEAEDKTYLCFVVQQKTVKASDYFTKALGCTKGIAAAKATSNAIAGVEDFFRATDLLKKYRSRSRDAVATYLQSCLDQNISATLEGICHVAVAHVHPDDIESVAGLKDHLNGEKCKVPAAFAVHGATLRSKIRIKVDNVQWSMQFEKQLLGVTEQAVFFYNEEEKTLTINSLPDDLVKRIETELKLR
ncbi:MAG TPA: nucleoid-associated protein [Bdellovibrio sp.]|nr:nucleoid-associated protein [Bdellovibrio sp.]